MRRHLLLIVSLTLVGLALVGDHWTLVLPDPSVVVPGTNVMDERLFLSPTRVLAVNGGALTSQTR